MPIGSPAAEVDLKAEVNLKAEVEPAAEVKLKADVELKVEWAEKELLPLVLISTSAAALALSLLI